MGPDEEPEEPVIRRSGGLFRQVGRFLMEWAFIVICGVGVTLAVDGVWSLFKPESAAGALLKVRQSAIPWAVATLVGLAIFRALRADKSASFVSPPMD